MAIVTQDELVPYQPLDYLCIKENNTEIACGFVTKASPQEAVLDLEIRSQKLVVGMTVARSREHRPCNAKTTFTPVTRPRAEPDLSDVFHRECTDAEKIAAHAFHLPATRYFSVGVHLLSPRLEGDLAVSDHWSLGLSLELITFSSSVPSIKASSSGTAYGGHFLLAYHLNSLFRGFYGYYGLGYMKGRLTLRGHRDDWGGLSMVGAVGYRFITWNGFGLGLSLGGYYFGFNYPDNSTPTYILSPFIGVEFGVAF